MKKGLITIVLLSGLALCSCTASLDEINDRLDDLESRVERLEELCAQMNTNITSLQSILYALQDNDYITSVSPIMEGDIVKKKWFANYTNGT